MSFVKFCPKCGELMWDGKQITEQDYVGAPFVMNINKAPLKNIC